MRRAGGSHVLAAGIPRRLCLRWRADVPILRAASTIQGGAIMQGMPTEGDAGARARPEQGGGGRWGAFWRGAAQTPLIPATILSFSFVGFGALTSEVGLSLAHTLSMTAFIFALPGQVVLVDQMMRGAPLLTAALAVTATAVRLMPMTVALMPVLRDRDGPKWLEYATAWFVAVTVWVEAMRRAPLQPRWSRTAYALGIGAALAAASCAGSALGFVLAGGLPRTFSAALLFLTPIYFLLSMLSSTRTGADLMPILAGLALGPLMHRLVPEWDLLITGLIGGTASFLAARWLRARRVIP